MRLFYQPFLSTKTYHLSVWLVLYSNDLNIYPSDFNMQNSELSSKPLGKEDCRRNVGTFQTNLTLYKGLDEAPQGQVKTSFMLR